MESGSPPETAAAAAAAAGGGVVVVAAGEIEDVEMEIVEVEEEEEVVVVGEEGKGSNDLAKAKDSDDAKEKTEFGVSQGRSGNMQTSVSDSTDDSRGKILKSNPSDELHATQPLLHAHNGEKLVEKLAHGNSMYPNVDGGFKKEVLDLHRTVGSQPQGDSNVSRPRGSSPGGELENKNKRPALLCDFFAQGWCVKGNSCRFLHQREGADADSRLAKEEIGGPFNIGDYGSHTGSFEGTEPKLSCLKEPRFMLNSEGSSRVEQQRALVRTYGGESRGLPHFHAGHNYPTSRISQEFVSRNDDSLTRKLTIPVNELDQMPRFQEEHSQPYFSGCRLGSIDDRYLGSGGIFPGRYLDEGKLQFEVAKGNTLSDSHLSRSSLSANPLIPEYRYRPFDSSISSDSLQNSNKLHAYGRATEGIPSWHQKVHYSGHDSYGPYRLASLTNSSFDSSVHSLRGSPLQTISHQGTSSIHRFTPTLGNVDFHKSLDFDKGYTPRPGSCMRGSSSPRYSRSDMNAINHPPFMASSGQRLTIQDNDWETSAPFRPSYCFPRRKLSPARQYDPLVDSIDPSKPGSTDNEKSPIAISYNTSSPHTNDNPILSEHTAGYGACKSLNRLPQPNEGKQDRSMSAKGSSEFNTPMASDGRHCSRFDGENSVISGKIGDKNDNAEFHSEQDDKGPVHRDSKAMKQFHFSLVEFVKELVKPFWKEGFLSKDAHKLVVKKAVEKVLASLEPHQVPATEESINHYLTFSQSKLEKLVKAYVDKHGNF